MGIRTTTIQAPWVNLVTAIITITSPVAAAPSPVEVTRLHASPARVALSQRRTMLACESVNERNTPTA